PHERHAGVEALRPDRTVRVGEVELRLQHHEGPVRRGVDLDRLYERRGRGDAEAVAGDRVCHLADDISGCVTLEIGEAVVEVQVAERTCGAEIERTAGHWLD